MLSENIEEANKLVSHIIDLLTVSGVGVDDLDKNQVDRLLGYIEDSEFQKIPNKTISWLFANHPDVYKEFYEQLP